MLSLKDEEPFAFVVKRDYLHNTCSFCFDHDKTILKLCRGCHVLSYCNEKCQKSDWINHQYECAILKDNVSNVPDEHIRLATRILLKSETALTQRAFNGRTWESLRDRVAELKAPLAADFYRGAEIIMAQLRNLKDVSREEVVKAYSKVIENSIEIVESKEGLNEVGIGIYLGLSVHKHSCLPDAQIIFTGKKASLHCLNQKGVYSPCLAISYTSHPPWFLSRKSAFKQRYFYDCTCLLCLNENHIVNRMGSSCYVNCCENAAGVLPEDSPSGPYICNSCGATSPLTVADVKRVEATIEHHLTLLKTGMPFSFDFNEMISTAMDILLASEKILSVYNFYFVGLCFTILVMAMKRSRHGMCRYIHDRKLKAFDYYLHETNRERTICLMDRARLKTILDKADDFDIREAINVAKRTFGEKHPVFMEFMESMNRFQLSQETQRLELSRSILRNVGL